MSQLILDLALVLGLAAITTLVCRWLKQPVVLGYILAGYLASNHFGWLPNIRDTESVHTLAELGIIFLLFGLGLEFSFKKLLKVGTSALTTAIVVLAGMMFVGFEAGILLGWTTTDSVFLAAMLAMSSTTIIIKALSDLELKTKKFATVVFGILVVEDLFAIIILVGLSSFYIGKQFEESQMVWSVVKLLFFLVVWLGIGLYLVPMLLERAKRWLTREVLLIVAIAMCLGMVVLANYVGFSSALGAFIMGSIFAETVEIKEIQKITSPVKDLFGAVFFVSVGMMVNPLILVDYWFPVVVLTALVIVGQILFSTAGMLLSGQRLDVAVSGGFSLVQIGEFAFIIATLGISLGVTSAFLYPVAVAVSVVTTFLTPFFIRMAPGATRLLRKVLPDRLLLAIENNAAQSQGVTLGNPSLWKQYLKAYITNILFFVLLLSGAVWLLRGFLIPYIELLIPYKWGEPIAALVALAIAAPLLWGLAIRDVRRDISNRLWQNRIMGRSLLVLMFTVRGLLTVAAIVILLGGMYSVNKSLVVGVGVTSVIFLLFGTRITRMWRHFRAQLQYNLREKTDIRTIDAPLGDLNITTVECTADSLFVGRTIGDLQLRQMYGISVVSIRRGSRVLVVPTAIDILMPLDNLTIVGQEEDIRRFQKFASEVPLPEAVIPEMTIKKWWVRASSDLVGRDVANSMIRERWGCLVVGLCRAGGREEKITPHTQFEAGDMIWLAGEVDKVAELIDRYR